MLKSKRAALVRIKMETTYNIIYIHIIYKEITRSGCISFVYVLKRKIELTKDPALLEKL